MKSHEIIKSLLESNSPVESVLGKCKSPLDVLMWLNSTRSGAKDEIDDILSLVDNYFLFIHFTEAFIEA